jgi:hypothetical protein
LFVRIRPFELTMKPDPAPVDGTEKGVIPDASLDTIVTTDGLTRLATRIIASDCVRLIVWALPGWLVAAAGPDGDARVTAT